MDYVSMMLQQEKNNRGGGMWDYLSTTAENSDRNKRFKTHMEAAQTFIAEERAKQEQLKEPIKAPIKEPIKAPIKEPIKAPLIKPDTPTKKRVKKEKIPATLKNIVWHKYFETSLTGLCQCCKVENISKAIFDAGHIISEANGGQVVLDNLKPICKLCNSSMGKTNMDDFMKKYGI
jgi:hypothetical protein